MATKKKSENGVETKRMAAEEFVRAWQRCATSREARDAIGPYATSRAKRMRDAGVKLKEFPREGARIDVAALNEIVDEEA